MAYLVTSPNLAQPDELYQKLIALHQGLDSDESAIVNAKLILLLANHIGDDRVTDEAIALARADAGGGLAGRRSALPD